MGLGKTVESLAIMCCLKRWRPQNGNFDFAIYLFSSLIKLPGPFLVVVPVSVLNQWIEEIDLHRWYCF